MLDKSRIINQSHAIRGFPIREVKSVVDNFEMNAHDEVIQFKSPRPEPETIEIEAEEAEEEEAEEAQNVN